MKLIFSFLVFIVIAISSFGQPVINPISQEETAMRNLAAAKDSGWFFKMSATVNTTQTYLKNWAAGGNSSLNITGLFNGVLNYRYKKIAWDNVLNLAYGRSIVAFDIPSIKTEDRFDFSSKYGQQASKLWYYSCLFSVRSQVAPGYAALPNGLPNYDKGRISDLFSPAYAVGALGMDYKPNKNMSVFLAPLTYRATFVYNQDLANAGQFGVEPARIDANGNILALGKRRRNELGGYIRINYTNLIWENVTWTSKLELFSNYIKKPDNIDLNWENLFNMKVNKYLTVSVAAQIIYDDDIRILKSVEFTDEAGNFHPANLGPGLQFRELTAIGFTYTFH
ncbi:MAG: DUF3078 domain-containing protein [Bacteroidetes bacterium]|nr:DUF3078 domain-containing protein [Bacteroidota bacterium]